MCFGFVYFNWNLETQQAVTRKPTFCSLGTKGKQDSNAVVVMHQNTKRWNKRAFGTDITNLEYKGTMLSSSVNRKPNVVQVTSQDLKECNLTTQKQLHGAKGYVFGPFYPAGVLKEVALLRRRLRRVLRTGRARAPPSCLNIPTKVCCSTIPLDV